MQSKRRGIFGCLGAIAGSLMLLARSRHAVTTLLIALLGLVGTTIYQYVLTETPESLQNLGLSLAIWATTLFMLWYAFKMKAAGVLR